MKKNEPSSSRMIALVGALIMFGLLAVDLITKLLAAYFANNAAGTPLSEYLLGFIRLYYTKNDGIAYGLFGGNETFMVLVTVLTVIMILAIVAVFFTMFKNNTPVRICLAVIEAGAIGNLVDRLILGYVRDFIDVSRIGFGVCNIADFCVTFGAVALVFMLLFIGEDALFPLSKKWREAAKLKAEGKEKRKEEANDAK